MFAKYRFSLNWRIIVSTLFVITALAGLVQPALAAVTPTIGFDLTGGATQTGRMFRDGVPSTCGGKAYPGTFTTDPGRYYATGTIVNNTASSSCVTVTLNNNLCGNFIHSAAYLGSFNPSDISQNYLGDTGSSAATGNTPVSFSFTIPAGETAIVVFHMVTPGQTCTGATASATPLGFGIPDAAPVVSFFNPGDGRVDPRPADRVAAYCGSEDTIKVIVIGSEGKGQGEVFFNLQTLLKKGERGETKSPTSYTAENVGKLGKVSLSAQEFDGIIYFYLAWNGGYYNATGVGDFSKSWTSPSTTCGFSTAVGANGSAAD
ncbi:MAG: hypothetical protein KF726_14410 [Anaerolineae bacterium]|nr:hypothetical protein [Anaerolineae bacterium]